MVGSSRKARLFVPSMTMPWSIGLTTETATPAFSLRAGLKRFSSAMIAYTSGLLGAAAAAGGGGAFVTVRTVAGGGIGRLTRRARTIPTVKVRLARPRTTLSTISRRGITGCFRSSSADSRLWQAWSGPLAADRLKLPPQPAGECLRPKGSRARAPRASPASGDQLAFGFSRGVQHSRPELDAACGGLPAEAG